MKMPKWSWKWKEKKNIEQLELKTTVKHAGAQNKEQKQQRMNQMFGSDEAVHICCLNERHY